MTTTPTTSRAAVYPGHGSVVEQRTIELAAPSAGEVLVRVRASGVCGSDRHIVDGDWTFPSPAVLGHEGAGVVVAVGEGVTEPQPGDHVIMVWNQACGRCVLCQSGTPWACLDVKSNYGLMPDGTSRVSIDGGEGYAYLGVGSMSEYAVVPASAAIPVPEELPFDVAALIGCSINTGIGAVLNNGRVVAGESAVVIGCGGVGLSIIMGLRLAGANPIIAVDRNPAKLELAREAGATHAVLADDALGDTVLELTGIGADVAFEAIGNPATIASFTGLLRPGGRGVMVGMPPEGVSVGIDALDLSYRGITLIASNYGGGVPARDFPRIARLYLDGRLPLDLLISHRIGLDDVNTAFDAMREGSDARSVVIF